MEESRSIIPLILYVLPFVVPAWFYAMMRRTAEPERHNAYRTLVITSGVIALLIAVPLWLGYFSLFPVGVTHALVTPVLFPIVVLVILLVSSKAAVRGIYLKVLLVSILYIVFSIGLFFFMFSRTNM